MGSTHVSARNMHGTLGECNSFAKIAEHDQGRERSFEVRKVSNTSKKAMTGQGSDRKKLSTRKRTGSRNSNNSVGGSHSKTKSGGKRCKTRSNNKSHSKKEDKENPRNSGIKNSYEENVLGQKAEPIQKMAPFNPILN